MKVSLFGSVIDGRPYSRAEFAMIVIESKLEVKTGGPMFERELIIEEITGFETGTTLMRKV